MTAVLLVEDVAANRAEKAGLLRDMAGRGPVIAVENSDAAIRAVRALPCFDLIVADINLPRHGEGTDNRDGVSFARWLRESDYPALLTGYSAIFSEGEIPKRDRDLFFDFLGRTEHSSLILEKLENWIATSADFRKRAWEQGRRPKPESSKSGQVDFTAGVVSLDVIDMKDEGAIKELLNEGFEVQLAYPSRDKSYGRAFFVWCREAPTESFVEVFGQPYLYEVGSTLDEAKEKLLVLMKGYHENLKDSRPEEMSKSVAQLRRFLCEVFNG
jgi:CheY-like chemotaxis protein